MSSADKSGSPEDTLSDLRMRLTALAQNFWWSWNEDLDRIFRAIDVNLWRSVNHNPIAFLQEVDPSTFREKERDANILALTVHAEKRLSDYLSNDAHWAAWNAPGLLAFPVAYFSAEICIHESLPIYSGGLGTLAGDHLKSCSDLGIPTYGISLLYRQGYFTQQIDENGRQIEINRDLDTSRTPLRTALGDDGVPITIEVPIGDTTIRFHLLLVDVGRCKLLLLDVREPQEDRLIPQAFRLYGGNQAIRIGQEMALGVGGFLALRALGVRPGVIHLNEGHSAFAVLEAIARHMEDTGMPFEDAAAEVADSIVFTTHTPVAAGHDRFPPALALQFLRPLQGRLALSDEQLLGLGRVNPSDPDEEFCMTVLALRLSRRANAVSSLHGLMSRRMWRGLWPDRQVPDVPIGHITNGVHLDTWLPRELIPLYTDCLGSGWRNRQCDAQRWRDIENLDQYQLWSIKVALKHRLLDFIARRLAERNSRLGIDEPMPRLQTEALTIGFGRRVVAYKRMLLFFQDMERARRILTDPLRPVQLIIAGKAHPADEPSKDMLRQLVELSREPHLRDHVVFLEDHDKNVNRHIIEGSDLWLNTPRRPFEACGTSGMKAVFSATLNCSTLDGWWDEAYDTQNGFAFGAGLVHVDHEVQDRRDRTGLMDVLEQEVVPLFYDRDAQGVPIKWLDRVKHALRVLAWRYNSDRMVMDYVKQMYLPASKTRTAGM